MPRLKESEKAKIRGETRALLLASATDEFARAGYDNANINRISINAGFAKGTIYNYFPSKRDLMLDLIDEIASRHYEIVSQTVLQTGDLVRRMELFFISGFHWVTDNLSQGRILFTTLNGPDHEFKTRMYMDYQPMFQLVARDILGAGIEQGVFRPLDPVSTSNLIMNIYLGTGSQVNQDGKHWIPAEHVTDFVLTSLQAGI
jgi:AcrR family transcriptional regulator